MKEPLARSSDLWTSHAAAESIRSKVSGLELKIVRVLDQLGPMTAGEIQAVLEGRGDIQPTTRVHKRMLGLVRQGRVVADGVRRDPHSGRMATKYEKR